VPHPLQSHRKGWGIVRSTTSFLNPPSADAPYIDFDVWDIVRSTTALVNSAKDSQLNYSARRASTGLTLAARRAGR